MGYYTSFSLKILDQSTEIAFEIIEEFREYSEDARCSFDDDGGTYDSSKWYDHENDLKSFSENYPDVVFELSGEGEGGGDIWKKYFKNGKIQVCPAIISFDDYDENKLV